MEDNKVVVAALVDDCLFEYLYERVRSEENVSMRSYSNMDIDAVKKIAGSRIIDLAIVDFDVYKIESERAKLEELFEHGELDSKGSMTRFVMLSNEGNEDELSKLYDSLRKRQIAMFFVSFDDKDNELDKRLVVHNIIAEIWRIKDTQAHFIEMRKNMEGLLNGKI